MQELVSTLRRTGAATLVAAVLAGLLIAVAPAAAAVTGSIVFIKDHNVWVMPAGDPDSARAVTTDGTATAPYLAPTQDASGRILAVAGGEGGDVVRMDSNGTLLGAPFRPPGAGNLVDLDVRADGDIFVYTHYGSFDSGPDPDGNPTVIVTTAVQFGYSDGRDATAIASRAFDEGYASFSTDRTFMTSYDDAYVPTVMTYAPGDAAPQEWFRPCESAVSSAEDYGLCFPIFSDVTTAQDRVAVSVKGYDGAPVGARLWVFDMPAPAPAGPTFACELVGPEPQGSGTFEFQNPEWSPDGSALVYEYDADPADGRLPDGIYVASGFDGGCDGALAAAELVVPGGSDPDWSAADFGAPVDPGPEPTEPVPGPTEPLPGPTEPLPDPTEPSGAFDGVAATTERLNVSDPIAIALAISRSRFADRGAARVVLSRDDDFPDSLAGATLSFDGPLLFTPTGLLHEGTRLEIERVLAPGGTVHVLGGTAAVSQAVEDELVGAGFVVDRLAGPSRVETAIAVADRVRQLVPGQSAVALARAAGVADNPTAGWADSVTGGGWAAAAGAPILVTDTAGVHPAVAAWLAADQPSRTVLFGGTAALSQAVEDAVPSPLRVAGGERAATAAAIATQLWGAPTAGMRRFAIIDGFHEDGWAFGLAVGGMAADTGAPLLVVNGDVVPEPTAALVSGCDEVDLVLVGSGNIVRHPAALELDALDQSSCG